MPKTILIQDIIPPKKRKKRLSSKRFFFSLFLLITLLIGISIFHFLNNQKESLAAPDTKWLPNWNYRKSHTINSATGAGTNYQVKIVVHKSTGTDTGEDVYLGTSVRDDFGDVRFTDNDGDSLLDYWMETYTSGVSATFWVEVQDDLGSNQTIYIYYGKAGETTTSDDTATFIFADDFQQNDLSKWASYTADVSVQLEDSNYYMSQRGTTAQNALSNTFSAVDEFHIRGKVRTNAVIVNATSIGIEIRKAGEDDGFLLYIRTHSGLRDFKLYRVDDGALTQLGSTISITISANTWYEFILRRNQNGLIHAEFSDGSLEVTDTAYSDGALVKIWLKKWHDTAQYIDFDNVRTHYNYVEPEPSHGAWGSEEKANGLSCLTGSECGSGHCLSEICSPIPGGLPKLPPMGGIVRRPIIEEPVIEEIEEPVIEEPEEPIVEINLKEVQNEIINTLNELIQLHNQLIEFLKDQI